jgi:hypothetical protein
VLPDSIRQLVTTPSIGDRRPPDALNDGGASKVTDVHWIALQGVFSNTRLGENLLPIVTAPVAEEEKASDAAIAAAAAAMACGPSCAPCYPRRADRAGPG